jgi:hypothetical protein
MRRRIIAIVAILVATTATTVLSTGPATAAPASIGVTAVRPDLDGVRIQSVNNSAVFLIIDGQRHWIPNETTYFNLFRSFDGIVKDAHINDIDEGEQLSDGAILARSPDFANVYLVSNGMRRWISSRGVFDRYQFNSRKIVSIPSVVLFTIPEGPPIV